MGAQMALTEGMPALKAILDSALGLMPSDVSAEARAARTVSLKKFDGMNVIAKIGEEKSAGAVCAFCFAFGKTRLSC